MESCLLCLKIHSEQLDCIRTDSKRWMELNIANTIEKHFWPLSTIRFNSFICSPCWSFVDDFHKFYLRIEEAHMKLMIKVETEDINDFCFQKPATDESIEYVNTDVDVRNECLEDLNEDTQIVSVISCKEVHGSRKDNFAFQKLKNVNTVKCRKRKCSMEKSLEMKKKAEDINNDLQNASDNDEDNIDVNSKSDANFSDNFRIKANHDFQMDHTYYEENDKLILSYLKQINCNICKIQLENFSALLKHFLEIHQQRGYILCCNRKFFKQKDLADHVQCHLNPNYFRCDQCDKMFAGAKFLEQHKLHEHNSEEIAKRYSCDVCNKLYLNVQSLKKHKLSHLTETDTNDLCQDRNKCYTSVTENNFEEPSVANCNELNASSNMPYTLLTDLFEPLPSSTPSSCSKNDVHNEDIFAILKEIAGAQKECNTRLKKLEQNQTKMMHHKSMLSNGQVVIVNNQQQIADSIEKLVASVAPKPDMITQEKLLTECKVSIKKVEESVCRMTDKTSDNKIKEIARILPLQSLEAVQEVEEKLETPDFAQAMMAYLHKVKGTSEDVSSVIRTIFTDDLLEKFNWEGRWEKQALGKLILFNKTLRDVFQQQKAFEFEKSVRKAVERSHHRMKQKKYIKKENK